MYINKNEMDKAIATFTKRSCKTLFPFLIAITAKTNTIAVKPLTVA